MNICKHCNGQDFYGEVVYTVGMYGGIVVENMYCISCGEYAYDRLIDNDGNIPPKQTD